MGVMLGTLVQKDGSRSPPPRGASTFLLQVEMARLAAESSLARSNVRASSQPRFSPTSSPFVPGKAGVVLGTLVQREGSDRWVDTGPSSLLLQFDAARRAAERVVGAQAQDGGGAAPPTTDTVPPERPAGPRADWSVIEGVVHIPIVFGDASLGFEGLKELCRKVKQDAIAEFAATCPSGTVAVVHEGPCVCTKGICTVTLEAHCEKSGSQTEHGVAVQSGF